jgi:hypothetical protein
VSISKVWNFPPNTYFIVPSPCSPVNVGRKCQETCNRTDLCCYLSAIYRGLVIIVILVVIRSLITNSYYGIDCRYAIYLYVTKTYGSMDSTPADHSDRAV